jgi:hypothetical protein
MSALLPKADIVHHDGNVRFVPKADVMQCSKLRLGAACLVIVVLGDISEQFNILPAMAWAVQIALVITST